MRSGLALFLLLCLQGCGTPKRVDPGPACTPTTCEQAGAACGSVDDGCDGVLDCGGCSAPETCGGGGKANQCGQACSETDAQLCQRQGAECGKLTATDKCGKSRTINNCGSCTAPDTCGGAGTNLCGCLRETDASMCVRLGLTCGPLTGNDNCGIHRSIASCGTCTGGTTCGGGGVAGSCGCIAESNAQFCTRLGKNCGALSGTDNCGKSRSVPSCGSCTSPQSCGGSGVSNVCGQPGCVPESNSSFCARFGRNCGAFADVDNCGMARSVASCGTCFSPQSCGGAGMTNVCGCASENDLAFCSRLAKNCGALTGTDNCGKSRTVASCGSCSAPQSCGGGGTANVCGCSETNAQMCTRLGKTCGTVTDNDLCGVPRTITSCGSCSSPQTCGGGGTANVCGCTGETDATFCTRLAKNCGTVSGTDNCGVARTVGSCGTCSAFASCGGDGVPNVCGGYGEPMQQVCGGGYCWENPTPVGTNLRGAKTSPSGSNWVVGEAGTVLKWNGSIWSGWFAASNAGLTAVWPFSDSDVWAVGSAGTIIHFNGSTWSPVSSGVTADLKGIWGAADGTLWVVGATGTVLKRAPGGSFVPLAPGTSSNLTAVFGIGGDVWMVGDLIIVRYNGASFSTTSAPLYLVDVWGASPTDIWAAGSGGMMRFTGTTWLKSTTASGYAVFGTSASNVWVTNYSNSAYRFDGVSWTSASVDASQFGNTLYAITGAGPSSLLAAGEHGALYRYDGAKWWRLDRGVPASGGSRIVYLNDLSVLNGAAFAGGSYQDSFTCCFGAFFRRGPSASWSFGTRPTTTAMRASSATNIWGANNTTAYRFDGTNWNSTAFSTTSIGSTEVAPISPTDAWVVGRDKTLHYDGATWTPVPNPVSATTTYLYSAAAVSANHVWAGGETGTLLLWNGSAWSAVSSGVTTRIKGLRAPSTSLAYAFGDFGVIRWNGSAWGATGRVTPTTKVWPENGTAYWVVSQTELKRWDGAQFIDMAPWLPSAGFTISDVGGAAGDIFVSGSNSEILKKQ